MKLGKKASGGKYIKRRKKKSYELPGQKRVIRIGEDKRKKQRVMGGNEKVMLLRAQTINVRDKNTAKKATVKNVLETPSNKFLARQNILTKGTIVETDLGKVRITNRPTQEGMMNGVIISE